MVNRLNQVSSSSHIVLPGPVVENLADFKLLVVSTEAHLLLRVPSGLRHRGQRGHPPAFLRSRFA
jgi:hypothetical protein